MTLGSCLVAFLLQMWNRPICFLLNGWDFNFEKVTAAQLLLLPVIGILYFFQMASRDSNWPICLWIWMLVKSDCTHCCCSKHLLPTSATFLAVSQLRFLIFCQQWGHISIKKYIGKTITTSLEYFETLLAPQSGAHSIGAFRDPIPSIHLQLLSI